MKRVKKLMKYSLILVILSLCFPIFSEEYSIRRKKSAPVTKKSQGPQKKDSEGSSQQFGYSKENNKLANQYWLEESAIFNPEYLDGLKSSEEKTEAIPEKLETAKVETTLPKTTQEELQVNKSEKPKATVSNQSNMILQFLSDNKKILLIISLIIIFAIYRLRGDTSSRTNQNTRIFSKFRNK